MHQNVILLAAWIVALLQVINAEYTNCGLIHRRVTYV
jgi:hypothetical protein